MQRLGTILRKITMKFIGKVTFNSILINELLLMKQKLQILVQI